MELRPLNKAQYQGHRFEVRYTTDHIYHVNATPWGFHLERVALAEPLERGFSDALFGDWLEDPMAFGFFEKETLAAFAEGSIEAWHNLFRVSNLFVEPVYRRQGLARRLLEHMICQAKAIPSCRGVILETQTCNGPAIALYRKLGFRLCRIDTHEYTNRDVARQEVRIDLIREL